MATKYWISTSSTSFSTAGNWSDNAAPANDDILIFNGVGTAACSTDLGTILTGVTVIIEPNHSAAIGAVAAGAATYLVLDGGTLKMPRLPNPASAAGPSRVLIDFGSTAATVDIQATNTTGSETQYPPVQILGDALTASVSGGSVGFAVRPGETATLASLRVTKGLGGDPSVYLGPGATVTSGTYDAGTVESRASATAATTRVSGATYRVEGSAAHTTLTIDAGKVYYNGSGTIATLDCNGTFDATALGSALTITTATFRRGYLADLDNGVPGGITFTNPINYPDGIQAGTLRTPAGVKGTLVAI